MNPPRRLLEDGTLDPALKRDLAVMAEDPIGDADIGKAAAVFTAALAAGAFGVQGAAVAASAASAGATAATGQAVGWAAKLGAAKGWLFAAGLTAAGGGVVGGLAVTHRLGADARTPKRPAHVARRTVTPALPPPVIAPLEGAPAVEPAPVEGAPSLEARAPAPAQARRVKTKPTSPARVAQAGARPARVAKAVARPAPVTAAVEAVSLPPLPVAEPTAKPAPEARPPSVPVVQSPLEGETQLLTAIRTSLERDPHRALRLIEIGDARYPRGVFAVEREMLGVLALHRLGRRDEAREAGRVYLNRHPNAPGNDRVRCVVAGRSESCGGR